MSADQRGILIAFEGPEGAGKSTQVSRAADALRSIGHTVLTTMEPGGTELGCELRRMVLGDRKHPPNPRAELFLYLADRAQHVADVIRPALEAGHTVLTDRFSGSTLAYQAFARGLDQEQVNAMDVWARNGTESTLSLLLDCPATIGLARAHGHDRFHKENEAFHRRVRAGFLSLARANPQSWVVLDATRPADQVHEAVLAAILTRSGMS